MTTLRDTEAVAEFMHAFGQPVRTTPTADIPDDERLLRVRLVIEEALEFAEAMGCLVWPNSDGPLAPKGTIVEIAGDTPIDLVEATDALGDIIVVTKGSAHSLGLPIDEAFEAIHASNMKKLGPDGRVVFIEGTNKVGKPEGWVPPTAAIEAILKDHSLRPAV